MWDWDVSWPGEKTKTTAALVGGCPAVTQAAWHDEREKQLELASPSSSYASSSSPDGLLHSKKN